MLFEEVEKRDFNLISIDRIDSSKDYTRNNIVLYYWGINRLKAELSVDNFIKMCKRIVNYRECNEENYLCSDILLNI